MWRHSSRNSSFVNAERMAGAKPAASILARTLWIGLLAIGLGSWLAPAAALASGAYFVEPLLKVGDPAPGTGGAAF